MPTTPRLNPRTKRPAHDITLTDGVRTFGIKANPADIGEIPQTPSTLRLAAGGGASAQKFGDFEPSMAQIVQADWSGGRGQENFSDDPSKFYNSQNAWTLQPGKLMPGPLFVGPLIQYYFQLLPGQSTVSTGFIWNSLTGSTRYLTFKIVVGGSDIFVDRISMWVRRLGTPGTLTLEIRTNSAGEPSATVVNSATLTAAGANEGERNIQSFDWTGTQTLSAATTYHVVIYGSSTDTIANHWDVGSDGTTTSTSFKSSDNSTWTSSAVSLYYNLEKTEVNAKLHFFELDSQLYVVSQPDDGTAAKIYMNGYRGKATGGSSTTIADSNQTLVATAIMTANRSVVRIINGTGVDQVRTISSISGTTITVDTAWDITPDTSSEYVVLGTSVWTEVTGHGLTKPVTGVAVTGSLPGVAYFAQGTTTMRRMRFDATLGTPAHEFSADGSNTADLLYTFYDEASKKTVVWRALNSSVQIARADAQAWGTSLTFGTGIPMGSTQFPITGMTDYDGHLMVGKSDSIWRITDDTPSRVPVGLESSPDKNNGAAMRSLGLFLYFSYMHSVEQLYGTTLSDLNPLKGPPVPGRAGKVTAMCTAFNWLFVAIDAGATGQSQVLCFDGGAWHEVWSLKSARRIRSLHWQGIDGTSPRLWIGFNGDVGFKEYPKNTLNPLYDSGFKYEPECIMRFSYMDMGSPRLPKFFKEVTAITENLDTGTEIRCMYLLNNNTAHVNAGLFLQPVEDTIPLNLGNARRINLRLIMITDSFTVPPILNALILEGYARTPVKYQYNIRLKQRPVQLNRRGGRDVDPDVLYNWLREAAGGAKRIRMRSRYKSMDNRDVIVEPPILRRQSADSSKSSWSGELSIVLRDA